MLIQLRKQSHIIFVALLLTVIFFSCKKDHDSTTAPTEQPDLATKVTASSVSGFVYDENNAPVESADIKIGTMSTTTNQFGFFEIKQVQVVKTAATITVAKTGYFKNTRTFKAIDGKSSSTIIKLIPKTVNGTIDATAGGSISSTNGLIITLPANAVVTASGGAAYTGTINVSTYWYNPSATDFAETTIGNQLGVNANGAIKLLDGFGGLAVELTGGSGELLQIASGKTASLTIPIPTAKLANAPASIALWYFDENTGLWKEDGTATKNGSNYIATVSHFSWWNTALASAWLTLTGNIADANNVPLQGYGTNLLFDYNGGLWGSWVNNSGSFITYIPDATPITLYIYPDYSCGTPVYSQTITGAGTDIDLGTININSNLTTTITGNLIDCNGNAVTNGCVYIKRANTYTGSRYEASNTGTFSIPLMLCGTDPLSIEITGQNIATLEYSTANTLSLTGANNALGNIIVCGNTADEFVFYNVDGTNNTILTPANFYGNLWQDIRYQYATDNAHSVSISYSNTNIALNSDQPLGSFRAYPLTDSSRTSTPIMVHITEFGNIGEYISGNFSGNVTEVSPPNTVHNVSCNFRIRRTE